MANRRCPYCWKEKDEVEFTSEHVLPIALGGNIEPANPFATKACGRCNSIAGRFVDGPFIRSWLVNNERAAHARRFADVERGDVIPFVYLGFDTLCPFEGMDCELWVGPSGDVAYHYHAPYSEDPDDGPIVGRPFARPGAIDEGFVILIVQASNPAWHRTILRSVLAQFSRSTIYLGNVSAPNVVHERIQDLPPDLALLLASILAGNGQSHTGHFSIHLDLGHRFLAKVALGLGGLLLGDAFLASASAARLRSLLWAKTPEARESAAIRGSAFLGDHDPTFRELLAWEAGHVIAIVPVGDRLILNCVFYGSQMATIEVADEPELWKQSMDVDGMVYVVAPASRRCVGPIRLLRYFSARLHPDASLNLELSSFLANFSQPKQHPPYHLDGHGGVMKISEKYWAMFHKDGERVELGPYDSFSEAEFALRESTKQDHILPLSS